MIGITGYSVYVPRYRLRRETIASAWRTRPGPGCKAVINYDEDSLTMGQAAAWPLLGSGDGVDALYFASTSAPYWQRSSASLIAAACDLPAEVRTADFGGSLRCGMSALRAAFDAVLSESNNRALVVASDAREGTPESAEELTFGDAAAAVMMGRESVIAELVASASRCDDFPDEWRRDVDVHVRSSASKYSLARGYEANMAQVARALLEKAGVKPGEVARAVLSSPDGRAQLNVHKALGIPPDPVEDSRVSDIGVTGAAMPVFLLAQALERSNPGELLLAAGYGDGAEGLLLRVIAKSHGTQNAGPSIEQPSYAVYRKLRGFLSAQVTGPEISNVLWKRLCRQCGTVQFPIARVCLHCRTSEALIEKPLGRTGRVFTFTTDFLYDAPVPPTVMAVVDLDGGGRFLCQMTDVAEVEIGMEVELVLRRMREGAVAHHYYWKCRRKQ